MNKPGYHFENSCVESFFWEHEERLQIEKKYDGKDGLSRNIFYYVEILYNEMMSR